MYLPVPSLQRWQINNMDFGNPEYLYNLFGKGIFPELVTLTNSVATLAGWLGLFWIAQRLMAYGSGKTPSLNGIGLSVVFICAIQLLYLDSSIAMYRVTLFETPTALTYDDLGYSGRFQWHIAIAIDFIKLLGIFSYVRGWMVWLSAGLTQGTSEGAFAKGLWYIIGGGLAIAIVRLILAFGNDFKF